MRKDFSRMDLSPEERKSKGDDSKTDKAKAGQSVDDDSNAQDNRGQCDKTYYGRNL